jgi:hypothetical protein
VAQAVGVRVPPPALGCVVLTPAAAADHEVQAGAGDVARSVTVLAERNPVAVDQVIREREAREAPLGLAVWEGGTDAALGVPGDDLA